MAESAKRTQLLGTTWVFALTMFLSAFLLFQVQLILSKHILPWFGGSAAVWTTCMLVYQTLLLGGYVYSHLISEHLSPKAQGRLHLVLLAAALLLVLALALHWPSAITPGPNWKPVDSDHPVRDVIIVALAATGLPFFVLSTTGPLLQRWFTLQGGGMRAYRLYSISNIGSLLGLLTFPFLLEPLLRLRVQGRLWAVLFALFCTACGWCAWKALPVESLQRRAESQIVDTESPIIPVAPLLWVLLAACASSLLLATTNQLCQEIITLPLLWVVPLAAYLLSFILCFDHPRWYRREIFHPLFWLGVFVLSESIMYSKVTVQIILMPLLLFAGCMICHGELVHLRPGVHRLTFFYLAVSAGGALGGLFVAIVAPLLFRYFTELQISLAACLVLLFACLFLDGDSWIYSRSFWLPCVTAVGVILTCSAIGLWIPEFARVLDASRFYAWALIAAALLLVGAYIQSRSSPVKKRGLCFIQPLAGAAALLAMLVLAQTVRSTPDLLLGERNFYGAIRILELSQGGKALSHGVTLHGAQLNPPNDRLPTTYYGPDSGIGILLRNHPRRMKSAANLRVGLVGLGTGTLAAYGRPGDYLRFYELNPQVLNLSLGPSPIFTFLRDSSATIETELGDARLLMEQELAQGHPQKFDILVLDAFSGDSIPVHLLTREAFDTYTRHLRDDDSVIALHLSSRHVNLLPVVEGIRNHLQYYSLVRFTRASFPFTENLWVFLACRPEALRVPGLTEIRPPLGPIASPRLWTDDHSDIFRLIY